MKKSLVSRATVAFCGVLSLSVAAEESAGRAQEEPAEMEVLMVTATLEPLSVYDVASSVTVITRDQIEQRQAKYLADLLRDTPGFSVSQAGGAGAQTQLRVRGAEANHMLVLIDGVRANDPASGDEFQFQYALTANIERIEIIRGPQSSIWGSDAMAGVINIIRRKDSQESWVRGSAEGGSFGTINASADGGISRGSLRLQGGVAHLQTDGINIAREGDEKDGAENTTANISLDWSISDDWTLRASGQQVSAETQFDDVDFFVTGLPVDTDRLTEAERNYVSSEIRYDPPGGQWSGMASLNYSDSDNRNFYDGEWNSATAAEVMDARLRGSVLLSGSEVGVQHRVTAALDYIDTDFSQRGIATPWGDPNQDQNYDQGSAAAEYVGKIDNGFTWTASARYNEFSDFDSISTWQVAFSHAFENFRLRGSVGTAFKAPTFTERFGFYADQFIGNPDLKPERSEGWELGFDSQWLDGVVSLGGAYYQQTLKDEIDGFVFDPETFLFTAQNKDSESERRGIELTAGWAPLYNLEILAHYTYTDASEGNAAGNDLRELRRPRHQAGLNAQYRFAADRAYANLNLSYTGEQYDVFYDPATFASERVLMDSYTVIDLGGGWKLTDSLELVARVTNLADQDYENVLGYSTRGRGYFAGLRGRCDW